MSIRKGIYLILGVIFGIILIKSEAASRWRIQEMFHFQSFHMYGIIGSAIVLNAILFRRVRSKPLFARNNKRITLKTKTRHRWIFIAGIIFGLGWALVGVCPGPIYTLIGAGFEMLLIVLVGAFLGTFLAGRITTVR